MENSIKSRLSTIAMASAFLFSAASLHGAEIFKANNTDDLNLDSSWEGGVVPGADDMIVWHPFTATETVSLGGDLSVKGAVLTNLSNKASLNFGKSGENYTLTLGSGGLYARNSDKTITVYAKMKLACDQLWGNYGGTLVFGNDIDLNGHLLSIYNGVETKGTANAHDGAIEMLAGYYKMSSGTYSVNTDFTIRRNAGLQFNQEPSRGGAARARNVTLDGSTHYDGATLYANGRKENDGNDIVSGKLSVLSGLGRVRVNPNAAKHLTLQIGSFENSPTSLTWFCGTNLGLSPASSLEANHANIMFDTAPSLVGGGGAAGTTTVSIIPYAVCATNDTDYGFSFATYDTTLGVRPLDLDTEYATVFPIGQGTLENVRLVNGGTTGTPLQTLLPDGLTVVNSLIVDVGGANGGGGCVLDAQEGASPTLRVASGMIYVRNMKAEPRTDGDQIPFQNFTLDLNGQCGSIVTRQSDINNMTSKALELRCPIVNDGGNGVNFSCVQNRGFIYLYGSANSTYTGPTRLSNGCLKLAKANSVQNVCIPGDLEIYAGTCQNTGDTIPDTSDIRIYGGSLIQKGGASNSGSGSSETFRDLTMFGGSYSLGASGTSSGGTTMRNAALLAGTMTQTRGHRLTVTGTLTLAGATNVVNRYEKSSNRTLQYLQGGISITNTPAVAYTPMAFDAGTSDTAPGAKSTLSVGVTFTGNTTNDNTAVIAAAAPGEGIEWAQFLMDGDLVFDIGDGAADVDLRIEPQLVDNGTTVGALAKRGTGTLALMNPTNTYTGGTSVEAGRLIADGALAGDVTVASGATFRGGDMGETGALSVGGDVTFAAGAKLEVDPGAATTVAGDVSFAGTEIVLKSGAEITEDVLVMKAQSFSGGVSGTFGRYSTRLRAGGTELWIAKDKGFSIIVR